MPEQAPWYWHAYHCGHYTYVSARTSVGIAWCELCRTYVGVIVQRAASSAVSRPATTTAQPDE